MYFITIGILTQILMAVHVKGYIEYALKSHVPAITRTVIGNFVSGKSAIIKIIDIVNFNCKCLRRSTQAY